MRHVIKKDVPDVISRIAKIGYKEVETFGYSKKEKFWGYSPKDFRALMRDHNISVPSGHFDFDEFLSTGKEENVEVALEAAKIVGQKYVTVPILGEHLRKSSEDYKRLSDKLNHAGELARKAGLQLAYHNHDFEFNTFENNQTGYDILLKNTDKKLVEFELDLFWASKAGQDPVALFRQDPGRFVMWHVKDLNKTTQSFTEVGTGSIDFKRIFANQKLSGVKHIFIEQDTVQQEVFKSIAQSYSHIKHKIL